MHLQNNIPTFSSLHFWRTLRTPKLASKRRVVKIVVETDALASSPSSLSGPSASSSTTQVGVLTRSQKQKQEASDMITEEGDDDDVQALDKEAGRLSNKRSRQISDDDPKTILLNFNRDR